MLFVDQIKKGVEIMLHPVKATKKGMGIVEGLVLYYKMSFIQVLWVTIVSLAIITLYGPATGVSLATSQVLSNVTALAFIGGVVSATVVWLAGSLLILLAVSALYQLIGLLLGGFKAEFSKTFSAFIYSASPAVVLSFLLVIPFVSSVIILVSILWLAAVLVIALSNLQGISILRSFGVFLISSIIIFIVVSAIAATFIFPFISSLLPQNAGIGSTIPTH